MGCSASKPPNKNKKPNITHKSSNYKEKNTEQKGIEIPKQNENTSQGEAEKFEPQIKKSNSEAQPSNVHINSDQNEVNKVDIKKESSKNQSEDEYDKLLKVNSNDAEEDDSFSSSNISFSDSDSEITEDMNHTIFPTNTEFCKAAEAGNLKKIMKTMQHPDFVDILKMIGYEKEVTIGEDEHNTELWNALLFAINCNRIKVVRFLVSEANINLRLALTNPEKREDEYTEEEFLCIEAEDELYGVLIASSNNHLEMFLFLWEQNFRVWTEEHFTELLEKLIE